MLTRNLVLLILSELGGHVEGKTRVQKLVYFVGELIGRDLGYRPHYYGPYSQDVADALVILKLHGFLSETRTPFGTDAVWGGEKARYDFRLTPTAADAVDWLRREYSAEAAHVAEAVLRLQKAGAPPQDIKPLSVAAKAHFIVKRGGRPVTPVEIAERAQEFGWQVTGEQIDGVRDLLQHLELIE